MIPGGIHESVIAAFSTNHAGRFSGEVGGSQVSGNGVDGNLVSSVLVLVLCELIWRQPAWYNERLPVRQLRGGHFR